jgi:hypothetical protein
MFLNFAAHAIGEHRDAVRNPDAHFDPVGTGALVKGGGKVVVVLPIIRRSIHLLGEWAAIGCSTSTVKMKN